MGIAGETLRLFFALQPDSSAMDGLAGAAAALPLPPHAQLVPRSNYHVTLAFIGEVAPADLSVIMRIGAQQVGSALTLRFDAFEYWPKPEVVVAAARAIPPQLQLLWQQLHGDLAVHGWARDAKRLRPHATLARKVAQAPVLPTMSPVSWVAREFCLMRSQLGGARPAYTVVATWPLLYDSEK